MPHLQRCYRLALFGVAVSALHLAWQGLPLPPEHIVHRLSASPQSVTVDGTLARAVDARGDRQHVYLHLHRLLDQQGWHPVRGLVRLTVHAPSLPFLPGDTVRVARVRLYRAHSFGNPGGFDYARFMRWQGIHVTGGVSDASRLSLQHRPEGASVSRTLVRWRQEIRTQVRTLLPEPYSAVFLAMVLGQRGDLPQGVQESFRIAGTTHLLVVSGLNVSCIAAGMFFCWRHLLRWLRGWLPRAWLPGWRPTPMAALLSLPPMLLYCTLVGWEVPTTRAALMVTSYLLALIVQRTHDPMQALVLAAALILVLEPSAVYDLSFQLSFVAVASIFFVMHRLPGTPNPGGILHRWGRRGVAYLLVNSAAYFGTLPIVAGTFHAIPTFAILANLPLVPLADILTQAGMVALCVLALWPGLAALAFTALAPLLSWTVGIAETIARFPGAQLYVPTPSAPVLVGYYGLLGGLLSWPRLRWRWQWAGLCLALSGAGLGWQYLETRTSQLRVTFLDVGTGDAIFVQIPGNHHLLIDGGGTYDGRFDIGTQVIAPFLWNRFVRRFDLLAMTHPHHDHARGLGSILRLFPARHLLTNGSPLTAPYLQDLLAAGQRQGTRHSTALAGPPSWQWERLQLTVLAPPSAAEQRQVAWTPTAENDRSLVLRLQYGAVSLLLTGDIQHATERWLLAHRDDLRADILQIPHHGSQTSCLPAFVQRVSPQVGIISVGANNMYGHPHPRVLHALAAEQVTVWRTDHHGAITVSSDGHTYQVQAFRPYLPLRPSALQVSTRHTR